MAQKKILKNKNYKNNFYITNRININIFKYILLVYDFFILVYKMIISKRLNRKL